MHMTAAAHLVNPLVTSQRLQASASRNDGVSKALEDSTRFETARLIQVAGILLRLPQEIIAQAIIILQRFWSDVSVLQHDPKDVAAASLYAMAKPSAHPVSPRQVLTTFDYISTLQSGTITALIPEEKSSTGWHFSEGQYEVAKSKLYELEGRILRAVGFDIDVALPYALCINYLQTLDVFQSSAGSHVAKVAFRHLNSALLSPQLLYLTHQPSAVATAAIYLAARQVGVKLPETEWWEVFDVDREELGFLVVTLKSVEGFAVEEKRRLETAKVSLEVDEPPG